MLVGGIHGWFSVACLGDGRGEPWRLREGDLRDVVALRGVVSRLRGCSLRLAHLLVAVTIMSP